MKNILRYCAAALVLTVSTLSWADKEAEKKSPNVGDKKSKASETSTSVDVAGTAIALARYGDANQDVHALVQAAKMLKTAAGAASKASREADSGKAGTKGDAEIYSAESILKRARELAKDRKDLKALIDDVAAASSRGATRGARRWSSVVSRRSKDRYRVTFKGGEVAAVYVSGDGDSDLDLYIYDENGHEICRDNDGTDTMLCRWTPAWTGAFIIEIRNLGVANRYVAVHN